MRIRLSNRGNAAVTSFLWVLLAASGPGQVHGADGLSISTKAGYESVMKDEKPAPSATPVLKLAGARNGQYSGYVIVSGSAELTGLSVTGEPLKHDGGKTPIGAGQVEIRYAHIGPQYNSRYDMLLAGPPEKATLVPVFITVHVPSDAAAGVYKGMLKITAGALSGEAAVEISVADWQVPPVEDFHSIVNIFESPETLAEHFKVDLWSPGHWALVEKSFAQMARAGNNLLCIPVLAETCFGNPEGMIVWVRKGNGYEYDLSRMDRYVDAALKYHAPGQIKFVSMVVFGSQCHKVRAVVSERSEAGKVSTMLLPPYGTDECEAILKPALLAAQKHLEARGLGRRMVWGVFDDMSPGPDHVKMMHNILPGVTWHNISHGRYMPSGLSMDAGVHDKGESVLVSLAEIIFEQGLQVPSPQRTRLYGWKGMKGSAPDHNSPEQRGGQNSYRTVLSHSREHRFWTPVESYRSAEICFLRGIRGIGWLGADFLPLKSCRGGVIFNSYYQSRHYATLAIDYSEPLLFAISTNGTEATIRQQNIREGRELAEARAYLENALEVKADAIPADVAGNARAVLDERVVAVRKEEKFTAQSALDLSESNRKLFAAAAAVARTAGYPVITPHGSSPLDGAYDEAVALAEKLAKERRPVVETAQRKQEKAERAALIKKDLAVLEGALAAHGNDYDAWNRSLGEFLPDDKLDLSSPPAAGLDGKSQFSMRALRYIKRGRSDMELNQSWLYPSMLDLQKRMTGYNVDLIYVAVPTKAEVYPERLIKNVPADRIISPAGRKILQTMLKSNVEVVDLLPVFLEHASKGGAPLFDDNDLLWNKTAMNLAAECVAQRLKRYAEVQALAQKSGGYKGVDSVKKITMRDLMNPGIHSKSRPVTEEERPVLQVLDAQGKPYQDNPDSPVLLAGDAHAWHAAEASAGIGAQIARLTGAPVRMIGKIGDEGQDVLPWEIIKELKNDKDFLSKRRVLVIVDGIHWSYSDGWSESGRQFGMWIRGVAWP